MNSISNVNIDTIAEELRSHHQMTGERLTITQWCKKFKHSAKTAKKIGTWAEIEEEAYGSFQRNNTQNIFPELTKKLESVMDLNDCIGTINKYKILESKANPKQSHIVTGNPGATKPIAIIITSDWHLGGKDVDYNKWSEDMLYIIGLPEDQFRIFLAGDLIDNFPTTFRSADAVHSQINPTVQKVFLREALKQLSPYLDVASWGNHDVEFDEKLIGSSEVENMLRTFCHYFYGKGYVSYRVGTQTYHISITHHLKGKSIHHGMQGNIKEWNESHSEIVIGAHKHSPGYMKDCAGLSPETGKPIKRHLIQVGTYKTGDDTYSQRYFKKGIVENPTIVLYPDEHKIVYFEDVQDAVKFLGVKPRKLYKFPKIS